jgi:hypothetical protein
MFSLARLLIVQPMLLLYLILFPLVFILLIGLPVSAVLDVQKIQSIQARSETGEFADANIRDFSLKSFTHMLDLNWRDKAGKSRSEGVIISPAYYNTLIKKGVLVTKVVPIRYSEEDRQAKPVLVADADILSYSGAIITAALGIGLGTPLLLWLVWLIRRRPKNAAETAGI